MPKFVTLDGKWNVFLLVHFTLIKKNNEELEIHGQNHKELIFYVTKNIDFDHLIIVYNDIMIDLNKINNYIVNKSIESNSSWDIFVQV